MLPLKCLGGKEEHQNLVMYLITVRESTVLDLITGDKDSPLGLPQRGLEREYQNLIFSVLLLALGMLFECTKWSTQEDFGTQMFSEI